MPKPTRLYLRTKENEYRRLAWFQNNRPNEMLLGLYGLSMTQPILRYMWPERELKSSELSSITYTYDDMTEVNSRVDHVTCHADGRFHIKTRDEGSIYIQSIQRTEPLGPDTGIFLELVLISDMALRYAIAAKRVKYPHVWVSLPEDHYVAFLGMFSGVNYNLETDMFSTLSQFKGQFGGTRLTSGTVKGLLIGRPQRMEEPARQNRPRGTIISFKFPVAEDRWHIKAFLFQ